MNSTVVLRDLDTGEVETYTLVYPNHADIARNRLSVLAPVGTAILGYHVGDVVRWRVPAGVRRLRVEEVLFQPERVGAFQLVGAMRSAGAVAGETVSCWSRRSLFLRSEKWEPRC